MADLGHQFATKDVSTHPAMLATHEGVAGPERLPHDGRPVPHAASQRPGSRVARLAARRSRLAVDQAPCPRLLSLGLRLRALRRDPSAPTPQRSTSKTAGPGSAAGKWMIALPIISCGLLGFVPPLWAATRVKHDPARQRRLHLIAGVLAVGALLAFA